MHGRLQPLILHKAAEALHLKVIALDRPGYCQSSPLPCRTVKQYPQDVVELCAQLRISKFSIMASSAGTLYALACTLAPETKDMVVGKVCGKLLRAAAHMAGSFATEYTPRGSSDVDLAAT
eukprot:GHRR01032491.1.p1 GENE.GHRR01032491.1~~GHRR01032491.1.p1  ORF type:complete len:121 (-),score=18.88 GHRR01032491.1:625-987(-)